MSEPMHEPLSWLTLERYALGELAPAERARVEARLAESAMERGLLDSILNDSSELPPLPIPLRKQPRNRVLVGSSMLAMAATLLFVFVGRRDVPDAHRYVSDGTKGGEVALQLHGEQSGTESESFAQDERFKLLVTCPQWLAPKLRVVMFQAGARYEPLSRPTTLTCGNLVPWPGAFSLDGSAAVDVCVSYGESEAAFLEAKTARDLEPTVVCTRVSPSAER